MRRSVILGVLVALSLVACRRGGSDERATDWRVTQLYGGPGSVAALLEPSSVEVFRVAPEAQQPEGGAAFCGVHRVTAGPFVLSAADAAELSRLLRDADTYDWRHAKGDPYRPTFGVRFTRKPSSVDLALDLESGMLTVHREGRRIGVEDFDAAAPAIRAILERAAGTVR